MFTESPLCARPGGRGSGDSRSNANTPSPTFEEIMAKHSHQTVIGLLLVSVSGACSEPGVPSIPKRGGREEEKGLLCQRGCLLLGPVLDLAHVI